MLEAVLASSRFLHYAALMALFGALLFPVYAHPGRFDDPPVWLSRWLHSVTASAALLALLSGVYWLLCVAAMMGGTPRSAFAWDVLWSVLTETRFGVVWGLRLALLGVFLRMTRIVCVTRRVRSLKLVLAAGVLASLAGVGHTQVNEGMARLVQMGSDGAHLLAAGAWLGGLLPLAYFLAIARRQPSQEHRIDASEVLLRFSGMGVAAVAVIIGSGLINSWFLVGSLAGLATTPYGQLLLVKLCLFAGMLVLAASNRYWLLPSLIRENAIGQSAIWLSRLRRHVLGEQALGLFVILIVSVLGTMQPAVGSGPQ
jgi:putative copper resistance protein D